MKISINNKKLDLHKHNQSEQGDTSTSEDRARIGMIEGQDHSVHAQCSDHEHDHSSHAQCSDHEHDHSTQHQSGDKGHNHGTHGHHHHSHDHHGHHHHGLLHHHGSSDNKQGLIIALAITFSIMLLEFIGGLVTNSLALLSDSGHMLSDSSSLLFSLIAFGLAAKAATPKRTFGNHRFEILAALLNAVTLFIVAGIIIIEAIERFIEPPTVSSGTMILIACIGLAANLLSAFVLMRKGDVEHNLNMRSAYLHVIGDALGSVGAIVAGLIMLSFQWYIADPIISVIVALLILRSAWSVLKQSLHILMEGTPHRIDQQQVKISLASLTSVIDVHDLHIWTITSNLECLSCHLVIEDDADGQQVLQAAIALVKEQYGINHATFQIETSSIRHDPCSI